MPPTPPGVLPVLNCLLLAAACFPPGVLPAARAAASSCTDDAGCQLNGACKSGACTCHVGWRGQDCGLLDLLPSADSDFPGMAYGVPPSSSVGSGGLASWGGSIVVDPRNSSLFHLFAAEMSLGCGLNAWYRNSVIIRATSSSPLGPFVRQEQVLGAFSHEPVVLTLPKGEGYVLYKIGCADNATTGSNSTWPPRLAPKYPNGTDKLLLGRCLGCANGVTNSSVFCPHPDQVYERECQDALFSPSLTGPWVRQNLSGFGSSDWPWRDVNLGLESHAPIILANGSLLTFTRGAFAPLLKPVVLIWTVVSDSGVCICVLTHLSCKIQRTYTVRCVRHLTGKGVCVGWNGTCE